MITIGNLYKTDPSKFDRTYAIVRSMKQTKPGVEQIPELSPSKDLFYKYLDVKKYGNWGRESFDSMYLPQFLSEMHDKRACDALNRIYREDKQGQNIALLCFCDDEALCHRSIIAGLMKGVGCEVRTSRGTDASEYLRYYQLYKSSQTPQRQPEPVRHAYPVQMLENSHVTLPNMQIQTQAPIITPKQHSTAGLELNKPAQTQSNYEFIE